MEIPHLTPDELTALARDVVIGKTYLSVGQEGDLLPMVFMPLVFMSAEDAAVLTDAGAIYEDMSKAGPRAINGYPMFTSCKILHEDDRLPLIEEMKRIHALLYPDQAKEQNDAVQG